MLKKSLWHRCFPVSFAKFLGTPFLAEHLWWLLLIIESSGRLNSTYFSNIGLKSSKYLLLKKYVLIINEGQIWKKFNEHFINVTSRLKLRNCPNSSNKRNTLDDLIEKLKFHSSILKTNFQNYFRFSR